MQKFLGNHNNRLLARSLKWVGIFILKVYKISVIEFISLNKPNPSSSASELSVRSPGVEGVLVRSLTIRNK